MTTPTPLRCASCTLKAITTDEYLLVVNERWRWHTATAIYCLTCTADQFNQNLTPSELTNLRAVRTSIAQVVEALDEPQNPGAERVLRQKLRTLRDAAAEIIDQASDRADDRAAQAAPEAAPTEGADMSDDVASLETLVRENSGGTITRDSRHTTGVGFVANDATVNVYGDGWMFSAWYSQREGVQLEPARMALVALCCDLGKMIRSGEYAEGMARAAKGNYLPRMECGGVWMYDAEFDEIMSRQPTADGCPS